MSELDKDFCRQQQHRREQLKNRSPRLIPLLLCLPVVAAASWWYSGAYAEPTPNTETDAGAASTYTVIITPSATTTATTPEQAAPEHLALRFEPGLRLAPTAQLRDQNNASGATTPTASDWIRVSIRKGDTLSSAFARHDLNYADSLAIAGLSKYGTYFNRKLRPGNVLYVMATGDGHVSRLKESLDPQHTLTVHATADGFSGTIEAAELHPRIVEATGVIHDSFYKAARRAGLTSRQTMELADLFKWEIDFAYGIQSGDRFTIIYNRLYKDGHKVADGHILAASFHTGDDVYRALRFTKYDDGAEYYRPDGSSLRRAFIRTPVDFTRVSSPFSRARKHPILDKVRAHEGTDFAAPRGTPIHASGNGVIKFRGRNGGYGNMVAIDHGHGITTRYGHMSRFASGESVGSHVKQGQVIGYVGSTGMSTGPHLHYEFRVDGVPQNPQTVDLPGGPPIPSKYMKQFKTHIKPLMARLKAASATELASNEYRD